MRIWTKWDKKMVEMYCKNNKARIKKSDMNLTYCSCGKVGFVPATFGVMLCGSCCKYLFVNEDGWKWNKKEYTQMVNNSKEVKDHRKYIKSSFDKIKELEKEEKDKLFDKIVFSI